jgi:flavin-dependent dehydrogenase
MACPLELVRAKTGNGRDEGVFKFPKPPRVAADATTIGESAMIASCLTGLGVLLAFVTIALAGPTMTESARQVPVVRKVDVVVVGGSTGGVAAAIAAAKGGASVFLAAPRTYVGDDMAGTLRLWLEDGEKPATALAKAVFTPARRDGNAGDLANLVTPMQVKATLDAALIEAKVEFLFGCFVTDVLTDEAGSPAGIVMANRAGRQAVVAKVVIDATEHATAARLAGVKLSAHAGGKQKLGFVVIGGEARKGDGVAAVRQREAPGWGGPMAGKPAAAGAAAGGVRLLEYTLELPLADESFGALAAAEQAARDATFHPGQLQTAELMSYLPTAAITGRKSAGGDWPGAAKAELDAFRPQGVERLYVLSARADMSRDAAAKMVRPVEYMAIGERVGIAACAEAKALAASKGVCVRDGASKQTAGGGPSAPRAGCEIKETLTGLRAADRAIETVPSGMREVPVLGEYDVVVIGGGTSGAPAGISAARQKARTLLVEYQHGLGGVSTLGLIGKYYHGYRGGFTAEIDKGVGEVAPAAPAGAATPGAAKPAARRSGPGVEAKMEYYRRELRKAGAEVWFGAIGCGAVVEAGKVRGVVVATPAGRGVVLARTVIDATGNADVAASAGAACTFVEGPLLAVQGTGLPPRNLGASYTNTDYTFADESDMLDLWRMYVLGRRQFRGSFDMGTLIDTRERRRIVGDAIVTIGDVFAGRTFADTVGMSKSNYDSHGYTVDPLFVLAPPHTGGLTAWTPYRSLLPRGLDGVLVIGLGMSAHRDAMPILRMQPDLQNQGYAAGLAAAAAAKLDGATRKVDVKAIQKQLVDLGCVPREVLEHGESWPLATEKVAEAVESVRSKYQGAEVLLAHAQQALPLVRKAYAAATAPADRLTYAHVLAVMGDATGAATVADAVAATVQLDKGWNFRGMGQFGFSLSRLDTLILALGHARDRKAVPVLLAKLALLEATSEFSHHRALGEALEMIGDPAAAKPLAALLAKPQMTGYWRHEPGDTDRSATLRELILARALYRLGDSDGVGRGILEAYAKDLRGVYAGHATAVLREKR